MKIRFALSLSLLLSSLVSPACLAANNDNNGVQGYSTLEWTVSHGSPQGQRDEEMIEKTVPALLAKHQYAELDKLADQLRASKPYPNGYSAISKFYSHIDQSKLSSDQEWADHLKILNDWASQYPDSKVAPAALVGAWKDFAWKARGSGYSDTVTEQGWKDFRDRLAKGREVLEKATSKKEVCPILYVHGQVIALGQSWELPEYDKFFEEAVKRFPNFNEFYYQKVYYLQPRWHGSQTEWADFAAKAADKIGGADGDKLYARLAWYVADLRFYDNIFTEFPNLHWARVDKGMQALLKEYPNSIPVQNEYLKLAIQAGKTSLAKQLLTKIGKNIDIGVWQKKANFFEARKTVLGE